MSTLEELEAKFDKLVTLLTKKEVSRGVETRNVPAPGGPSSDGKNPCGCEHCQPARVCHWWCSVCGHGPYKFSKGDPGAMPALRPHFVRGLQKFVTDAEGVGRWTYGARYCCTQGCAQRELRLQNASLVDTASKRPDLADAIAAQLEAGGIGGLAAPDAQLPDLVPVGDAGDGTGAGGGDDLE